MIFLKVSIKIETFTQGYDFEEKVACPLYVLSQGYDFEEKVACPLYVLSPLCLGKMPQLNEEMRTFFKATLGDETARTELLKQYANKDDASHAQVRANDILFQAMKADDEAFKEKGDRLLFYVKA